MLYAQWTKTTCLILLFILNPIAALASDQSISFPLSKKAHEIPSLLAKDSQQAANKLEQKLKKINTLRAHFQQVTGSSSNKSITTGFIYLKKPNLFSWKIIKPYKQDIIIKNRTLWKIDFDLLQVVIQPINMTMTQLTPFSLLNDQLHVFLSQCYVSEKINKNMITYQLIPKKENQIFKKLTVSFDQNQLSNFLINDALGNEQTILFSAMTINKPLSNQFFTVKYSKKYDVNDQRVVQHNNK